MDRRDFLRQLKSGLWETVREVASPFIENDLRKLEAWADTYGAYGFCPLPEWVEQAAKEAPAGDYTEHRIAANEPLLLLVREGEALRAFSGKCPACGQLLHRLPHRKLFRCFGCENEIAYDAPEQLTAYPVKRKEDALYIGIPR